MILDGKTILQYESYEYTLNNQEYDNLLYHCKQLKLNKCKVYALDVGGRKAKGEIDLFLPHLQAGYRNMGWVRGHYIKKWFQPVQRDQWRLYWFFDKMGLLTTYILKKINLQYFIKKGIIGL